MKTLRQVLVVMVIAVLIGGASHAVPPQYVGPLGNPDEPALRPYKALWQGTKAIVHRSVKSFVQGNAKIPVLGSAETFRGVRRGVIDCAEYTYRSMQGSRPPRGQEYKAPGSMNDAIENDLFLRNISDFAAGGAVLELTLGEELAAGAIGIWTAQKAADHYPVQHEDKREAREDHAKEVREARKGRREAAAKPARPESPVERAQRRYLGKRRVENKKPIGAGNLLELAR